MLDNEENKMDDNGRRCIRKQWGTTWSGLPEQNDQPKTDEITNEKRSI